MQAICRLKRFLKRFSTWQRRYALFLPVFRPKNKIRKKSAFDNVHDVVLLIWVVFRIFVSFVNQFFGEEKPGVPGGSIVSR